MLNIYTIKPIDEDILIKAANETDVILTVEEHQLEGGLRDSVARILLESDIPPIKFKGIGIKDVFCSYYGSYDDIKEYYGLTRQNIINEISKMHTV